MKTKPKKIDLEALPPAQRKRVERALRPRDTLLGTRHPADTVDGWRREAARKNVSLTDWVETALEAARRGG